MHIEPTNVGTPESQSNVENLQIEITVADTNTTDVWDDVLVTKYVTFNLAKQVEQKSWRDNVFEVRDRGESAFLPSFIG